jgi:hypothetical protein
MKVIFLDIDGVLNCEDAYLSGECKYVEWTYPSGLKDHHQSFCSWSKEWLNKVIRETGAKIVISSTWRTSGLEFMKKVWELEGMEGEIIGLTPYMGYKKTEKDSYRIPRGCEIDYFLENHLDFTHINWDESIQKEHMEKSGIENYIIIDDDADMLYGQKEHFIHVLPSPRNKKGFNEEHYKLSLEKLNKTIIELNY